jgi:hypothetical protein
MEDVKPAAPDGKLEAQVKSVDMVGFLFHCWTPLTRDRMRTCSKRPSRLVRDRDVLDSVWHALTARSSGCHGPIQHRKGHFLIPIFSASTNTDAGHRPAHQAGGNQNQVVPIASLSDTISSTNEREQRGIASWVATSAASLLTVSCSLDAFTERNGRLTYTCTETKHFIYFYVGHCAILLFKTQ